MFQNPYAATIASSGFIIHVLRMDLKASQPWSSFSRWWMIMAIVFFCFSCMEYKMEIVIKN